MFKESTVCSYKYLLGGSCYSKMPKRSFIGLYKQHFWKLIVAGFTTIILNLPFVLLAYWIANAIFQSFFPGSSYEMLVKRLIEQGVEIELAYEAASYQSIFWQSIIATLLLGLSICLFAPVQIGIMRYYQTLINDEMFFWKEDFGKNWKRNLLKGSVHTFLTLFVMLLCALSIYFYSMIHLDFWIKRILSSFVLLMILLVLMLQPFIYLLMLRLREAKLLTIYKVASLLVLKDLFKNLKYLLARVFVLVSLPLLSFFLLTKYALFVSFATSFLLTISTTHFLMVYQTEQMLERTDLKKLLEIV